jgi:hypothetical protein
MRSLAIAFVLALAALAVTPPTAAIPPVCLERNVQEGPLTAHVGQCDPQYAEVDLCPSWGSPERHIHQDIVGPQVGYVDVEWCAPHSPPPSVPASNPGPCGVSQQRCPAPHYPEVECPPQTVGTNVDHQNSLTLSGDCSLHLVTGKGQICVGAWSGYEDRQVGPLRWERYYCEFPGGSPLCCLTTTAMADPFPTCVRECTPPILDGCDLRAATPTTVGPLPLNPQQAVWGSDCDVDVEPIGACAPPSGRTIDAEVLFLDISLLVCGGGIGDVTDGWS